jgi:hypothetical protein
MERESGWKSARAGVLTCCKFGQSLELVAEAEGDVSLSSGGLRTKVGFLICWVG